MTYADANFNAATLAAANITLDATGTASGKLSVSGSGTTRTVSIAGITGDGTLGISIAGGTASDLAGNLAPATGPSATFNVDNTPPTISIGNPSAAYTRSGPITYTVTYASPNFNASTLTAANVTLDQITGTAAGTVSVSGSGKTYTVTVSNITGDGTLAISIAAGTATDMAGNKAPPRGPRHLRRLRTPPAIDISVPTAYYTRGGPIVYTVTYVSNDFQSSNLTAADISLDTTGTAKGGVSVSGSGTSYNVTVNNITGDGTMAISIAAGTATDMAGNLAPAAGPSTICVVDNTAPTISIGAPSADVTAGGARHLHRDLCRRQLRPEHAERQQRDDQRHGQRRRQRRVCLWLEHNLYGLPRRHHRRRHDGHLDRRRHRR